MYASSCFKLLSWLVSPLEQEGVYHIEPWEPNYIELLRLASFCRWQINYFAVINYCSKPISPSKDSTTSLHAIAQNTSQYWFYFIFAPLTNKNVRQHRSSMLMLSNGICTCNISFHICMLTTNKVICAWHFLVSTTLA